MQYNHISCALYCQCIGGVILKNLNCIISKNLKNLRDNKKLSLDAVAKITGVSKSMLGQIERGEVNPTISTIWKITNGLKVSFTTLLSVPQSDIELVQKKEIEPLVENNGNFRNYPIFPFDETRRFETYSIELDKGGHLDADPHPHGTQEFITVFSGELTLKINGEVYIVRTGDSIRFKADVPHTYNNSGEVLTQLSMVIYYPL